MDNSTSSGPSERSSSHHHHSKQSSQINGGGPRRPQTISSPIEQKHLIPHQIQHILTVHKDSNGYGMKVSGDKPVFVESVKPGGASMKAGLIAGDMILKVNGIQVQSSTHTEVVQLIKSSPIVELTVQRGHKMRPSSLSAGQSTPLAQRGGITAPLPVDREKRRQMEVEKRHTLRLMLDQEKKNLENLESSNSNNRLEKTKAEATIRTLEEQLRQVGGEDSSFQLISQPLPSAIINSPPQQHHSTPAFLSRFPRSLSSLSIGTKKKSTEKENSSPSSTNLSSSSDYHSHLTQLPMGQQVSPSKKKMSGSALNLKQDIPPPLPQRNAPRKSLPSDGNLQDDIVLRRSGILLNETMISDLDHSIINPVSSYHNVGSNNNSPQAGKNKKRTKTKIKALSDPKMSSQMFIDFEMSASDGGGGQPPPLPPRQPGMMEENLSSSIGSNKSGSKTSLNSGRPLPNSIDTMLNYPLISTCTTVRDNMFNPAAFPLSHRPNIVQQLQQQQQQQQQHQQRQQQQHHHHKSSSSSSAKNSTTFSSTAIPQMNQLSSKHRRVVSSPEALHSRGSLEHPERMNKSGSWDLVEKDTEETPPGTPPPPYLSSHPSNVSSLGGHTNNNNSNSSNNNNNQMNDENMVGDNFDSVNVGSNSSFASTPISAAQANVAQKQIISMEDDEMSDQESFIDDSGAFKSLSKLLEQENTAHLAVFLNYVMTNSDPSALLFYLITGLYKEGTVKDMRKWAYEIHSTFLVPRAPLLLSNVDEQLAREVDDVLQHEYEKGEILRKIFWKSRLKSKDFVNHQLQEFSGKRIAGLGAFFGPTDQVLLEARGDKTKEQKIIEETLIPKLQQMVDELDKETPNECPKKSAMCSALSTVLHRIFVTRANPGNPIDKVHHFVSREKSFKSRLLGKNRKILVRGHHLILRQYYEVTHCNHCQNIIWGVSPQGYFCTDCELNIHRACTKVVEENCPGPAPSKKVKDQSNENNKIRNFMEKIRPTNHLIQSERSRRHEEDGSFDDSFERPAAQPVTRQSSDRRPDVNNSINSNNASSGGGVTPSDVITPPSLDTDSNAQDAEHEHTRNSSKSKSAPVSVNRSESYKETISQKRNRNNRRKTSDPSLTKVSTDEQVDLGLSNANLTQSSNSSLSSSLESTSTSLEAVGAPTAGTGTVPTARQQWIDSDDEHAGEINESDWSSNVDADILKTLTDQEKKRQEIINEIYVTERNHVRTLKLLDGIFLKPLRESNLIITDFLTLLFPPALSTLKELHIKFESKLKQRRNDSSPLVSSIGDILIEMFDGATGEELKDCSAQFCCRQVVALEALKVKRRKDENLHKLLSKQESHRACRRLQLKDLLPTVLQRLTKYPLLFESLYKITLQVLPDNEQEHLAIKKSLENSKQILDHVNQAVRIADNSHKLQTIQRKLDKANYEKEASNEFKNLDLTQHKLIHDGPLIMKKNPGTQLHGLLFENMMVLLHKHEERYVLKYHSVPMAGANDNKAEIRFNPITKIHLLLIRQSAVDKNTFFLINTNVSQMLELTAPSKSECKIWFKHISDAAESYKARTRGNNHEHNDDAPQGPNQKDSFESSALDHSQPPPTPIITPEPIQNNITIQISQDSNENINNNNNSVNSNKNNIYENNQIINNNNNNSSNDNNSCKKDINNHDEDDDGDDTSDNENDKIVGETNSNETRTLTQQCSLVAPCEVQININPAHTAEPVITPAERLRRLDDSIRSTLMEKQRIVCDMFRVPNEHFEAIADIAGQPEASKKTSFQEPSDIVLAAFAQVQSLTEILNECIKVTTHQEISAVSTSLCDVCYHRGQKDVKITKPNTCIAITTSAPTTTKISQLLEKGSHVLVEDEDGYCEIDELRISNIPSLSVTPTNFPPLPSHEISTPPTPTSPTAVNTCPTNTNMPNTTQNNNNSNDAKRQSTVSADSIPEETEHEINALLPPSIEIPNESDYSYCDINEIEQNTSSSSLNNSNMNNNNNSNNDEVVVDDDVPTLNNSCSNIPNASESNNIECINDAYDSASQMSELNQDDESTLRSQSQETQRLAENLMELCGTSRLAHVQSLVPSIPCHLITGYVTMLNEQITRLLPKLEERDIERDQLRKEIQHLRELLNSKYEKERVSESEETLLIDNNSSFDEPQSSHHLHKEDPNSSSHSAE